MKFDYVALDKKNNRKVRGSINAMHPSHVKSKISAMQYKPLSYKIVPTGKNLDEVPDIKPILGNFIYRDSDGSIQVQLTQDKPKEKDIVRFTGQLVTLLQAGIPLLQCVEILSKQQRSKTFELELKRIYFMIQKGTTFSEALSKFPDRFDTLFVGIVKSGESTGNLDTSLQNILDYLEKAQTLKKQIKSALTYPGLVVVIAVGIMWAMLTFVVPSMAAQFQEGQELPQITQFGMAASEFMQAYFIEFLLIIGLSITVFIYWRKTDQGRFIFDHFLVRLPGIGGVIKKVVISRFCNVMSSMLSSGVPLIEVIETSIQCLGNKFIESVISKAKIRIQEGQKLHESLDYSGMLPSLVISMIAVGERSGELDGMLRKVSEYYEEEVQYTTARLLALLEPSLIVVVGGFIALILMAMYLPMFDMAGAA